MEYNRETVSQLLNVILSDDRYMVAGGNLDSIDTKIWQEVAKMGDTSVFKLKKGKSINALVNLRNDFIRLKNETFSGYNKFVIDLFRKGHK